MTIVRCPIHGIAYEDELEACPACATEPAMAERWQAMAERPKIVPMLHLGIEEHRDRPKGEPVWQKGSRHATTLTKEPSVRVVLTVPQQGNRGGHTRDDDPVADDRFGKVNVTIRWKNGQFSGAQELLPEMPTEFKALLQERKW